MILNKHNSKDLMEFFLGVVGIIFFITFIVFLIYYCFFEDGRWLIVILSLILCLPLYHIFLRNKFFLKFKILKSTSIFLFIYTTITIIVDSSVLLQNRKFQLLHPNWVQIKEFEIKDPKILIEKRRKVPDISYINLQVKYQWENNNYNNFLEKVNIREQPWFIYNSSSEAQEMKRKLDYILKSKDYELYINIHSPKQAQLFFGIHTFDWRQSFIGILIIQVFQALFLMILPFIIYVLYLKIIHKNKS